MVLPSPNGATLAIQGAELRACVIAGCPRNASAVARMARQQAMSHSASAAICVIAAGERWDDDSLRPALEDLWGLGAILAGLSDLDLSPEARAALACFRGVAKDQLRECTSAASS